MSDSPTPRRTLKEFELDAQIRETKKTFDSWLERAVTNGPSDLTAATGMAAASAQYTQLVSIKLSYFS